MSDEQPETKLSDVVMTPEIIAEIQRMVIERITNLELATRSGASPVQALMAEICVIEAKLDALMQMLEDQKVLSYREFADTLIRACKGSQLTAQIIRQSMLSKPNSPTDPNKRPEPGT